MTTQEFSTCLLYTSIVVLTVISLIVSLLLALVNGMTAPVIKENTRRTTLCLLYTSRCV